MFSHSCWFYLGNFERSPDIWTSGYRSLYCTFVWIEMVLPLRRCIPRPWWPGHQAQPLCELEKNKKIPFLWKNLAYSKSPGWTSHFTGLLAQAYWWRPCQVSLQTTHSEMSGAESGTLFKKIISPSDTGGNEGKKLWNRYQAKEIVVLHAFSIYSFSSSWLDI